MPTSTLELSLCLTGFEKKVNNTLLLEFTVEW